MKPFIDAAGSSGVWLQSCEKIKVIFQLKKTWLLGSCASDEESGWKEL